jgi:hypothetical protein
MSSPRQWVELANVGTADLGLSLDAADYTSERSAIALPESGQ